MPLASRAPQYSVFPYEVDFRACAPFAARLQAMGQQMADIFKHRWCPGIDVMGMFNGVHGRTASAAQAVVGCRQLGTCDLFITTWEYLFPVAPIAAADREEHDTPIHKNTSLTATSSLSCLAEIQRRLHPQAVSIESQPPDVVPHLGNATWWRREADKPFLPLGGLRSYVYAAEAVSALKRRHCAVFQCGPYDAAVR